MSDVETPTCSVRSLASWDRFICFAGIEIGSLALLCFGAAFIGIALAHAQNYRFGVTLCVPEASQPVAISWVLAGGVVVLSLARILKACTRSAEHAVRGNIRGQRNRVCMPLCPPPYQWARPPRPRRRARASLLRRQLPQQHREPTRATPHQQQQQQQQQQHGPSPRQHCRRRGQLHVVFSQPRCARAPPSPRSCTP